MKKETKIEIPAGCEVEKVETQDGHVVVTFREKERILPKSWEEFCKMFPLLDNEMSIDPEDCTVFDRYSPPSDRTPRDCQSDILTLPDRATAEAVLALCQLIQLRNAYNGDWVPDFEDANMKKHSIEFYKGKITVSAYYSSSCSPLYFESEELCEKFLHNFRDLIAKLKPLYGIREGGEE